MAILLANSEDPDQMPHSVASDLGLHCLSITLLQVSRLQWVNIIAYANADATKKKKSFHICRCHLRQF